MPPRGPAPDMMWNPMQGPPPMPYVRGIIACSLTLACSGQSGFKPVPASGCLPGIRCPLRSLTLAAASEPSREDDDRFEMWTVRGRISRTAVGASGRTTKRATRIRTTGEVLRASLATLCRPLQTGIGRRTAAETATMTGAPAAACCRVSMRRSESRRDKDRKDDKLRDKDKDEVALCAWRSALTPRRAAVAATAAAAASQTFDKCLAPSSSDTTQDSHRRFARLLSAQHQQRPAASAAAATTRRTAAPSGDSRISCLAMHVPRPASGIASGGRCRAGSETTAGTRC